MSLKCLLNGLEVSYPCSPVCALFGDCCTAFEVQKKSRVATNADHIRAMSDEELAKFIPNWSYTDACKCGEHYVDCNNECEKCVAEWLQQPYEEANHGKA